MEIEFIIKAISTVILATSGWIIAHYFTSKRDLSNKRREIKTQYLVKTYQKIDQSIEPEKYTKEWCESLQTAFSEIQLFGTANQISLAHRFADMLLEENKINQKILKELLIELRNSLRDELGLESTDSNIGHLRIVESSL